MAPPAPRPAGGALVRVYQFPGEWYVGRADSNPEADQGSCVTMFRCSRWWHGTNVGITATSLVVARRVLRTIDPPRLGAGGA